MIDQLLVAAPDTWAWIAAGCIAELMETAIAERGHCSLALCGGSTPVPVYHALARRSIRWPLVHVYFGDERAVSPADPASNYRTARRALFERVSIPPSQVHRMEGERADRDAAADAYAQLLPPRLDLLLLGVGPDGHTASLFPGSSALRATQHVVAVAAPNPPLEPSVARLTITPPVITAALSVIVLAAGGSKAAVLARILDGPAQPDALPAQLARRGRWIVDELAAAQLQPGKN